MNGTRPPAKSVFHAIAWSASTHRWARIIGGVVVGVGAMLALNEVLGRPG